MDFQVGDTVRVINKGGEYDGGNMEGEQGAVIAVSREKIALRLNEYPSALWMVRDYEIELVVPVGEDDELYY